MSRPREFPRIIGNEIVGQELPRSGNTFGTVDPTTCDHPTTAMVARGNKHEKWWTCKFCGTRWIRQDVHVMTGIEETDDEWIGFGRYRSHEMGLVRIADPNYCKWVLETAEKEPGTCCPALLRFARYLARKEREEALEEFQEQMPGDIDAETGMLMEENEEASNFGDLSTSSWQRP